MRRTTKVMILVFTLVLVGLLGVGLVSAQRIAREETLYIAGQQWGPPTSFNPIGRGAIAWPVGNNSLYVYETLYAFNLYTGDLEPILAEKHEWIENDMVFRLTLFEGTRWQDGELTAEDVKYTLELGKQYPVFYEPWWHYVNEVRVVDARTIDVVLNQKDLTGPWSPGLGQYLYTTQAYLETHRGCRQISPGSIEHGTGRVRTV